MREHKVVSQTYDSAQDTFRVVFPLGPVLCLPFSLITSSLSQKCYGPFSIYLEVAAILPQLVLLQRTKNIDTLTGNYVFLLGGYRAFYLLNWYIVSDGVRLSPRIVWVSEPFRQRYTVTLLLHHVMA